MTGSLFQRMVEVVVRVPDPLVAARDWSMFCDVPVTFDADSARVPLGEGAVLALVAGEGGGITRIALEVDDPDAAVARADKAGVVVRGGPDDPPVVDVTGLQLELRAIADGPAPSIPSPFRRIRHVVVAVHDDEDAIRRWQDAVPFTPLPEGPEGTVVRHHVPAGDAWFGLTAAGTDADAVGRFVARRGEGAYALALVVDDLASFVKGVQARGGRLIGDVGHGQVFLHPAATHGVLVELLEEWPGGIRRP